MAIRISAHYKHFWARGKQYQHFWADFYSAISGVATGSLPSLVGAATGKLIDYGTANDTLPIIVGTASGVVEALGDAAGELPGLIGSANGSAAAAAQPKPSSNAGGGFNLVVLPRIRYREADIHAALPSLVATARGKVTAPIPVAVPAPKRVAKPKVIAPEPKVVEPTPEPRVQPVMVGAPTKRLAGPDPREGAGAAVLHKLGGRSSGAYAKFSEEQLAEIMEALDLAA